jgi:hypothetical protein
MGRILFAHHGRDAAKGMMGQVGSRDESRHAGTDDNDLCATAPLRFCPTPLYLGTPSCQEAPMCCVSFFNLERYTF